MRSGMTLDEEVDGAGDRHAQELSGRARGRQDAARDAAPIGGHASHDRAVVGLTEDGRSRSAHEQRRGQHPRCGRRGQENQHDRSQAEQRRAERREVTSRHAVGEGAGERCEHDVERCDRQEQQSGLESAASEDDLRHDRNREDDREQRGEVERRGADGESENSMRKQPQVQHRGGDRTFDAQEDRDR